MSSPIAFEGGLVARAKQTDRAEARRRYRQTATGQEPGEEGAAGGAELDYGERRPGAKPAPAARQESKTPSGRVGFLDSFRQAYRAPRVREDLRALPSLLRSRGFLAAVGLVVVGAGVVLAFPNYTGSRFAWELLVFPGSALAPQLVAGFFAPRASYLLGLLVGIVQGIVFSIVLTQFGDRVGSPLPPDQIGSLLSVSFVSGPIYGALFAAAAAWYRRFLSLSSARRPQPSKSGGKRSSGR
jgi:hypothetical protein